MDMHPAGMYHIISSCNTDDGVDYRSMIDECLVDYTNKVIYPIDLKTSSSPEDEFYKSFIKILMLY